MAPDRRAIVDELGTLTFVEVNDRTHRLTNALASEGVKAGDRIAIMARKPSRIHRGVAVVPP